MNCSTSYKEETMQFLKSVADHKAQRMRMTSDLRKETSSKLHYFHMKQAALKKQLMREATENHEALMQANNKRMAEYHAFSSLLAKEGHLRAEQRRQEHADTCRMLSEFGRKQHDLKEELNKEAKQLHQTMKKLEDDRLHEFKTFQNMLAEEKRERQLKTTNHLMQTQAFLNECHKHQSDMARSMQKRFHETQKARGEILAFWSDIHNGHVAESHESTMGAKKGDKENKHAQSQSQASATPALSSQSSEGKESMNDLLMKVKAIISGFHEGCRFSELHRGLDDTSKATAREAIAMLLAANEIRKDEHERFHII
ncbi:MAG TPA: hypothetical protein V6C86_15420 [Oculatellaceae cyanobacterium]